MKKLLVFILSVFCVTNAFADSVRDAHAISDIIATYKIGFFERPEVVEHLSVYNILEPQALALLESADNEAAEEQALAAATAPTGWKKYFGSPAKENEDVFLDVEEDEASSDKASLVSEDEFLNLEEDEFYDAQ